jgi:gas vesicle protein
MKTAKWIASDIAALVIGGLIGAGIALLMAPQSGRATRAMLSSQGIMLREKANEEAVVTRSRVKNKLNGLAAGARIRAAELGDRVQTAVDQQQVAVKKALSATPLRVNGH